MAKVQRVPRPLLALLGIVGENPPQDLTNEYHGSIEMLPMVIAELAIEQTQSQTAAAAQGANLTVTVPQGEVWFTEGVQLTANSFDGTAQQMEMAVRWIGGELARQTWIPGQNAVATAGQIVTCGWSAAAASFPIIARAGDSFFGRLEGLTAATTIGTLSLIVRRRTIAV